MYGETAIGGQTISKHSAPPTDTELCSLLSTVNTQAVDILHLARTILNRVSPMPEEGCSGDAQCFGGGYVGQAEQARSTQRQAIELLGQLSKFA